MNRLPSIPSRPAPPQSFPSYPHYPRAAVAPSPPDFVTPSQHHRPRDPDPGQSNAQQLPSLRTLLEPELLDNKLADAPPRPAATRLPHASSVRFGSTSPTLKRRHDFDGYSHEPSEHNAIAPRAPPVHRHAHPNLAVDAASSLPFTTSPANPASRHSDFSRHGSLGRSLRNESVGTIYRPSSTTLSASSDPSGLLSSQALQDDPMDISKGPARRRTESSSRAPVQQSRCVGQREIPGEGICYVYEDGTFCRAIIDGEAVNPSWGITKAGKPRKRLAQACLTCREKKIKCEPGYPKCHQCAKSQRACRGGLNQTSMSNASEETSPSSSAAIFKNPSSELVSPVAGPDKPRPLEENRDPSKTVEAWNAGSPFRPRNFRPTSVATSRDMSVHSADSDWSGSMNPDPDDPRRVSHQDQLAIQWEQDPFETDSRLTMHLLDLYFLHAGRATYGMLPRKPFLMWVESNREKNSEHLMLLYSVLAVGSIFSNDLEVRNIGKTFASIAAYGTEKRFGRFTLQLCQSRLMLALYNFARGKSQEAWDFCGAGLRALSALKLHTEDGVKEMANTAVDVDYGFDRHTLEECCRRTFWTGFLMDRYNGFCGGTLCLVNIEDTFLRLPCLETAYELSNPSDTPYFDFDLLTRQPPSSSPAPGTLGHMAYLTLISAIWGEVLTFTNRAVHRPDNGYYERNYETFYVKTYERLEAWLGILPANLSFSPQNLDNSIIEGNAGIFISIHALYHTTIIRLNRHVKMQAFPAEKVVRNLDRAFRSASHFLSLMHSLAPANRQHRLPPDTALDSSYSTPFSGYALMLSIDVLSSAGTTHMLPTLVETIGAATTCIEELGNFWASARTQHKAVTNRLKQLTDIAMQEERGVRNGIGQFWRTSESLETAFGNEDAVYKANDDTMFRVLGELHGR
ncbi:hypothetical protein EJ04DRAFT_436590 [Polyplosphaeria fusca]|uniref:Zn(2)-C6 fungal-type domain-containing protein n=1 Tax=Polyplosphaeria fusca TaxID=682080 RepID=A0A9P4R0R4_9PLEO|nr:hypothetical protein EJ04DRAFT_436590 [Polyplosphaeria fusca]